MIKLVKPLDKKICGTPWNNLHIVGQDESIVSNGHWAVRIHCLREGDLIKSPDYVRAYLGLKLDKLPGSSVADMIAKSRSNGEVVPWDNTGWRNTRGNTQMIVFSNREIGEDSKGLKVACFHPAYIDFFGIQTLWGTHPDSIFTDVPEIEGTSFLIMPVRAEEWLTPLLKLLTAHPELA